MAGEAPKTPEPDPFAAVFAGLSGMKPGDSIPDNLDFTKPVETAPTPAEKGAAAEIAADTTGVNAGDPPPDPSIKATEGSEERPVAATHKADGSAFTPEEVQAEQARLDREFDEAKEAAKKTAEEAAAKAAKTADDDAVGRLAETLNKRLQPQQPQPTETVERDTAPKPFAFTADEQAVLTQYEKDFPDVIRAESLLRRREYHNMMTYIFKQFNDRMAPAEQMLQALAQRTHHDDLTSGIDGYSDELIDKVEAWIEKQPTFLKAAYTNVMTGGTAAEVKEVITRFRADTGTPAPAAKTATPVVEKKIDEKAKAAAASLAPVDTKRSGTTAPGVAKDDFEGAFKQFSKE